MKIPYTRFIVASVVRPDLSFGEIVKREADLEDYLTRNRVRYMLADGCYRGVEEKSIVISLDRNGVDLISPFHYLRLFSDKYQQESILFVNQLAPNSMLYYLKPHRTESLGKWQEVDEAQAKKHEAYTKVNDSYYVCES